MKFISKYVYHIICGVAIGGACSLLYVKDYSLANWETWAVISILIAVSWSCYNVGVDVGSTGVLHTRSCVTAFTTEMHVKNYIEHTKNKIRELERKTPLSNADTQILNAYKYSLAVLEQCIEAGEMMADSKPFDDQKEA